MKQMRLFGLLVLITTAYAQDELSTSVETIDTIDSNTEESHDHTRGCCKFKEFCQICVKTLSVSGLFVSNGETIINGTLIINGSPLTNSAITQYAFLINTTLANIGPTVSIPFSTVINTPGITSDGTAITIADTGIYKVTWTIPTTNALVTLGLQLNGTTVPGGIFDTNQTGELVGQAYVAVTSPGSLLNLTNTGGIAFIMASIGGTPLTTMTIEKIA